MNRITHLAALGAVLSVVATAHADSDTANPHLEEVIVSAPLAKSAADTALPVGVLSGERLREEAASTIGESLNNQLGVQSSSFGPGVGQPVIRGQSGNRVRVLQDGISTLDAADVSPDHSNTVEPLLAERIEIIRGPATLLYGNGAVGGVVNVVDDRVPDALSPVSGALELRHNSVNDQDAGVFRLDGSAGPLAWHLDGMHRDSNRVEIPGSAIDAEALIAAGEEAPEENTRGYIGNSDTRSRAATAGLSWITENGFIGIAVNDSTNDYGLPGGTHDHHEEEEEEEGTEEEHHEDANVRIDMEQTRVDLKSQWNFTGPITRLDLRLSRNDYEHRELEISEEGTEVGTVFSNEGHEGRLVLNHAAFGPLEGAIGLQFGDSDFSAVGEEAFIPAADIRNYAVFLVEELNRDNWTYEFGLRHENQRIDIGACDSDQSTLSASASALWDFRDDSNLLMALSRSERSATVEELFSNTDGCVPVNPTDGIEHAATARIELGDPDLDKELSHNIELGLRKTAGKVTGELSVYYNEIQNYTFLQDSSQEVDEVIVAHYRQRNAAFTGYEFSLSAPLPVEHLSAEIFSDYVRARFTEINGDVPRIPAQRFGAALRYARQSWSAGLRLTQVRDQDRVADNETETGGYTLLEASADYHVPLAGTELTLFIKGRNLLDEEIRHHTSLLKNFAPAAGRSIESGVRLSF